MRRKTCDCAIWEWNVSPAEMDEHYRKYHDTPSVNVETSTQQEAGPRSKRHPKSVEGLGVKGEGE